MKAPALLILLLFTSTALAQQPYYGTTASEIKLPLPADPGDAPVLKIRQGETITEQNIRDSIQALYNTGHYRSIAVDAMTVPGGTQITFQVEAQYYFSTFRLEPENLLDRPITSYFPPPLGKKFSTPPVDRLVMDTVKLVEENGYFNAMIAPVYTFDPKTRLVAIVLKAKASEKKATILAIRFNGEQKILSEKELHDALNVSKGDDYNADKINKGIVRLQQKFIDKGYLTARVRVDPEYDPATNGVKLNIEVIPGKTTTVKVSETGTTKSEIPDARLRTLVPIFEEGSVDSDLVEEGRDHIVEFYQQLGYFDASATSKITGGDSDSVLVQYSVDKGIQHRVRSVLIEGSSFFPAADILKKMKTREGRSASHGMFSPPLLAADIGMIKALYLNAGFRNTTVEFDKMESGEHDIDITIRIKEGLRSVLGDITFTGNKAFTEPELWRTSKIQSDEIYSPVIINEARNALATLYYSHGYSDIRVDTHVEFESADDIVNVRFDLNEGPQYRIGWIVVAGNTLTAEKVITRASKLHPDDPYNPEAILEAQQRLYALGIFNRVEIVTIDQDLGPFKNLLIQIEDAKPILLTPGFGVTELSAGGPSVGPRATIELSDNNLFGLNRTVSFRVRGGYHERQFQTSYRDPRLINHDLEGIASLSFDKSDHRCGPECSYKANDINVSLRVTRQLTKKQTLSFSAIHNTVHLEDANSNPNLGLFPNETGAIQLARLESSYLWERRDSAIDPTHGTFTTADFQVADKRLGSSVNFLSFFNQTSFYTPASVGVIASSIRIGWKRPYGGDTKLPISEQFFAGGSTTLRGFRLNEAGPPGGGQVLTIANLEYRVPLSFLPLKNLGGALFYDTGNVFDNVSKFVLPQFTQTVGTGLRYKTPLGPIRVDLGYNLRPKPDVQRYRVFFTLGHAF